MEPKYLLEVGSVEFKRNVWGHGISISNFSIVVLGPVPCISLICYMFDTVLKEDTLSI